MAFSSSVGGQPPALSTPGTYEVESSWKLADLVKDAVFHKTGRMVDIRPVPELEDELTSRSVRPMELLLGLGKTTSALPGLHQAGAAGLPGLTALRTASRWAIIRYLWAFAEARPDLRLSALTSQVRNHQRSLFSEHFGIAIATDLVEQLILTEPARVVDADAVNYDAVLGPAMEGLGSHKPDYFWYNMRGRDLTDVVVLEAKGNSSGRRMTILQLARGVQQVLVPKAVPGASMRRIVIGACLAGRRIKGFALEVGEPDDETRGEIAAAFAMEEAGVRPGYNEPESGDWVSEDALATPVSRDEVVREAQDLDRARLFAFAGLPPEPAGPLFEADRQAANALDIVDVVDVNETSFRCETSLINLGGRYLSVRTGVAEGFLSMSGDTEADFERRRALYTEGRPGRNSYAFRAGRSRSRPQEELSVVTSADGCMLSLSMLN
ncbi:hypothetical protein MRQ36_05550 [Micromonospora sp. R77]|uniref:hypothetical protein n=1 Tax=Micromonospora sp. R77 TaxID=2925836 RepID=UPI001F60D514|nr:hypothetical protein [Micromonospora sp. R77]MCI4062056.1 hypothetical protein [Micromonospora sp. R77]